ncbi:RHS repeat-associated core domain-containing protein [Alishewanella sp. HH-ZS]|uniref:RHS repeat-associated core domain-containing protein n=1 Tax=Alishewanella sp. HH-ZS TaxID=1856684 RepID=UPI00082358A6|nr:RHS repeat-associated core domain-containing protein [Alishewanella sp. HH-ZS]OCW96884.1 hypothetical protein A9165_09040 [Alishewanella sp. HH-ZS]
MSTYESKGYTDYYYLGSQLVAKYADPRTQSDEPGYTGHVEDNDLQLTYMQQRYYDPIIGRFYSNDPVGFTASNPMMFNRYAYANNNPYKYTDPDGKFPRNASDMARYRSMGQMQQAQQQIRQAQSHANDIMAPNDPAGVALGGVGVVASVGVGATGIGTLPAAGGLALSLDSIRTAWTGNRSMLGMGAELITDALDLDKSIVNSAGNVGDSITNMSGGPGAVKGIIKGTATAADAASIVSSTREAANIASGVQTYSVNGRIDSKNLAKSLEDRKKE